MIDFTRCRTGDNDSILVLKVQRKQDDETSPYLFECVTDEIESGSCQVILDFPELDHFFSPGLVTLVRTHSRMRSRGGAFNSPLSTDWSLRL